MSLCHWPESWWCILCVTCAGKLKQLSACETIICTFNQNHIYNFTHKYFRLRCNLSLCELRVHFFVCRLLCLFRMLMENKSNWMTFCRGIICYAWTEAGGLSVDLDLIKGAAQQRLLFACCTCSNSPEHHGRLYTRQTMRGFKGNINAIWFIEWWMHG